MYCALIVQNRPNLHSLNPHNFSNKLLECYSSGDVSHILAECKLKDFRIDIHTLSTFIIIFLNKKLLLACIFLTFFESWNDNTRAKQHQNELKKVKIFNFAKPKKKTSKKKKIVENRNCENQSEKLVKNEKSRK